LSAAGHEVLHVPARRTHRERRRQGPGKTRSGRRAADVIPSMLGSRGGGRIAFARVQEVRRLLEVEIAGLAAERRSAEDLRDLDALLRRSAEAQTPEEWPQADVDFHARLAEATHNLLFPVLLGSMAQILMELRLTAAKLPGTPRGAQVPHEAIYEAVREQSQADARRAMREHMAEAEATLQRARLAGAISTLSSAAARRERRVSPARSSTLGPRIGPRLSAPTKRTLRTIQARGLTPGALRRCPVL
jgi:GntR family transcriptional regulator, transcriptional repressor for pyruvate dehydrogenase complex